MRRGSMILPAREPKAPIPLGPGNRHTSRCLALLLIATATMYLTSVVFFLVAVATAGPIPIEWKIRSAMGQLMLTETEPAVNIMASGSSSHSSILPTYWACQSATVMLPTRSIQTPYTSQAYTMGVLTRFARLWLPADGFVADGCSLVDQGPSHRARIPNYQRVGIQTPSGAPLPLNAAALDLERGTYLRSFAVAGLNSSYPLIQRIYAHRKLFNVLVNVRTISCVPIIKDADKVRQEFTLENPSFEDVKLVLSQDTGKPSSDINLSNVNIVDGISVISGPINTPELPNGEIVSVSICTTQVGPVVFSRGTTTTVRIMTILVTSLDSDFPDSTAASLYKQFYGDSTIYNTHTTAWSEIWQSRIEIGGNLDLARTVNSSLYYILSSARDDRAFSLSPGGLASNSYNGHVFWDTETWMYPTLAVMYPSIASGACLEYRFQRLREASDKARSYNKGYRGYMFPWESAFTGAEVTPTSADTGIYEQHISGDIAFAITQFWRLHRDVDWMQQNAFETLRGIAEFWVSRVEKLANGMYGILGVTGPDEYHVNIDNSVYTNVVAKMAIESALSIAAELNITSQIPSWSQWQSVAANMYIPFDFTKQIHLEYDGYAGQQIKQADVVLLGFPLGLAMAPQIRLNDLQYYAPRTDPNGPAMTDSMHVVAMLEVGNMPGAQKYWPLSYANVKSPYGVWTETPQGGAINFITGAGGFLQGVLFGWGGLRIADDKLTFNLQLPPATDYMKFNGINYRGNQLAVVLSKTGASVELLSSAPRAPMLAVVANNSASFKLPLNVVVQLPSTKFTIEVK